MSVEEFQLRVENLPPGTKENALKICFQNHRKQGGGKVTKVSLEENSSAIITFEEKIAVQTVLNRGNSVTIKDTLCKVYPLTAQTFSENENPTPLTHNPSSRDSMKPDVPLPCFNKESMVQIRVTEATIDIYTGIIYFLEDADVNTGKFYKDYVFMDGLKKVVYVPFHDPADAQKFCETDCRDERHIEKIEMVDDEVFDTCPHSLSIHGFDFSSGNGKSKLERFVNDRTKVTPKVLLGEEPCSAILIFDKKVTQSFKELHTFLMKCVGELDGSQLVTAAVKRSTTVQATVDGKLDVNLIQRHFKNKNASGGGPIKNFKHGEDENVYFITYEKAADAESVLEKNHPIGFTKITTKAWHHCLSKEAYESYRRQHIIDSFEETKTKSLPFHQYALLQRSGFISTLAGKPNVLVKADDDANAITINGSSEKIVKKTENEIDEKLFDFVKMDIQGLDRDRVDFICQPDVLEWTNAILDKEGKLVVVFKENNDLYFYGDSAQVASSIDSFIKERLVVEKKCYAEKMMVLTCDEGKQFISDLHKQSQFPCRIETQREELVVFTFKADSSSKHGSLLDQIEAFMNKSFGAMNVPFPNIHQEYASHFLGLESVVGNQKVSASAANVIVNDGNISITGLKLAVDQAFKDIKAMRESITVQDVDVDGFGIMDYLRSADGMRILDEIGKKQKCILKLCDSAISDTKGSLIGSCAVDRVTVNFFIGDITSLNADVIVNPIDSKRTCQKGMNQVLIQNGGAPIQQELDDYTGKTDTGTIVETKAGKMRFKAIYHLILDKSLDANTLQDYVNECLSRADQAGLKSLTMPLLGCGRFKVRDLVASVSISKALKRHGGLATSLKEVIICDIDENHIQSVMSRFDDVTELVPLKKSVEESVHKDDARDSDSSTSHPVESSEGKSAAGGPTDFGTITLTIKQGDLLQEKCDVIICGLKDNMDLKLGGAVSKGMTKLCGPSLQMECSKQADEFKEQGVILTSSNGLPCQGIIFVSMSKFSRNWYHGVIKALSLAEEKGFTSAALPVLGAGSKRVTMEDLKSCILNGIKQFGKKLRKLKNVRLVIFDQRTLDIFQDKSVYDKKKVDSKGSKPSFPMALSKTAKVKVAFQNIECGRNAAKVLKDRCSNAFSLKTYDGLHVKDYSDKQVKELKTIGEKKLVKVSIQKEANTYTLESFNTPAMLDVQDEITKFDRKNAARALSQIDMGFKWQFLSSERWRDFDPRQNIEIEMAFKNSKKSVSIQDQNGRTYRIDFQTMKEFSVRGDRAKEITTVNRYDIKAGGAELPKTWDNMANGENLKIVELSSASKEYKDIEQHYKNCGAQPPVKKIQRIQNILLYQQYCSKRTYFEKSNPKGTKNEMQLFHGTDPAAVVNINESGFNRSFCGKNATAYGNGVYFAEESSYSVGYARADNNGNKMMYVARVLVGISTDSKSGMSWLSNKPGTNVPYDSGRGPKMFIIFHDCQAYPEYLITF